VEYTVCPRESVGGRGREGLSHTSAAVAGEKTKAGLIILRKFCYAGKKSYPKKKT